MEQSEELPLVNPGTVLQERYRIDALVGGGGFGQVYRGFDQRLLRKIAVKVHKKTASELRFLQEARALASLNHRNIVMIYDYGTTENRHPFFIQEWIEG